MQTNKRLSTKLNNYFGERIKLTFIYESGFNRKVIIVTQTDEVYEFGTEISAKVSLGDDSSTIESAKVAELCGKNIVDFAFGEYYVKALTKDGLIYSWPNISHNEDLDNKPKIIEYFKDKQLKIIAIKCGNEYSFAKTEKQELYTWGRNPKTGLETTPFQFSINGIRIKNISCGSRYSLALTKDRKVYYWLNHRLEDDYNEFESYFSKAKPLQNHHWLNVAKVCCGKYHNLLLTTNGYIYSYGSNYFGQLGYGFKTNTIRDPKRIEFAERFKDIETHFTHNISAAVSTKDVYYIWGECGEDIHLKPISTEFKSFNEIFIKYCRITYKTIKGKVQFDDTFIYNEKYKNRFKELKQELGSGSFGAVYEAIDKFDSKRYAIKKIRCETSKEKELLNEFIISSEFKYIKHERLVRYYDAWLENTEYSETNQNSDRNLTFFIQMEFCGQTLEKLIQELHESPNMFDNKLLTRCGYCIASDITIQILEGVDYLHKYVPQIIHRDLNPDNIMIKTINNKRFVKIADFGLVAFHASVGLTNDMIVSQNKRGLNGKRCHTLDVGGVLISAPEVRNLEDYDTKADIYSLGIVFQKLFNTNSSIIDSNDFGSIDFMAKYKKMISYCSEDKMLSRDPNNRPNCEDVINAKSEWALS